MNKFKTVIDFGSKNLRIGIFDETSNNIYSSFEKINNNLENQNIEICLNKLIRNGEKKLSTHLEKADILIEASKFSLIDISIRKKFDEFNSFKKSYSNLIDEANFIISENNFKNRIIHIIVKNITVDNNKKIEFVSNDIKIKYLSLEIKFICLNKSLINDVSNKLKKNNLNISNIYCSSYVKSIFYKKDFETNKNFIFLDIGFERSSVLLFSNNKLEFFNSIPIGGNNITNDISQILKLSLDYAEDLKIRLHKKDNKGLLIKNNIESINPYIEVSKKNISVNLLRQIVEARVEEIIDLILIDYIFKKDYFESNPVIIFIGGGSKVLSNTFNLNSKNKFSNLIFFEEEDSKICEAGFEYDKTDESMLTLIKKKTKKQGFFENFFNLFSK